MDTTDLKVLSFNAATMALSFSEIEAILKILLLVEIGRASCRERV